jgi:hypothetical protein
MHRSYGLSIACLGVERAEILCRSVAERYADHSTSLQVPEIDL